MEALVSFTKDVIKLVWCKVPTRWGTPSDVNTDYRCSRFICSYCPHSAHLQEKPIACKHESDQ